MRSHRVPAVTASLHHGLRYPDPAPRAAPERAARCGRVGALARNGVGRTALRLREGSSERKRRQNPTESTAPCT